MDRKCVALMMLLVLFIMAASVASTTIWKPHFHTHMEDTADHLPNHMAGGLSSVHSLNNSNASVWNGRNLLEERHRFSSSMDPDEKRDVQALLSFKDHIKQDPYGRLDNWTAQNSKEVCSWYGITCKQHTRRVLAIILPANNESPLEGTLSASLGRLYLLLTLNLSGNNFTGRIPALGKCTQLSHIDFSYNSIGGRIPMELGLLQQLKTLDLSFNKLEDTIPSQIGNCKNLSSLSLNSNSLKGSIPHSIGQLKCLVDLDMSSNLIFGNIPHSFSGLVSLMFFNISKNHLNGEIPNAIGNLIYLIHVDISHNNISGSIPKGIGNLECLEVLDISHNNISGSIPKGIGNLKSLLSLDISNNNIYGSIPNCISGMVALQYLFLSENKLSGDLGNTNFPTFLFYFSAHSNYFSGTLPTSLNTSCKLLDLRKNRLEGELPWQLGNFQYLRVLSIGYNNLHGDIPQSITNLTKLQVLDLSNNKFSGRIPFGFEKMQGFRIKASPEVENNDLYSSLVVVMKGFEYTLTYVIATNTIIDLSNNNLVGEIPTDIGTLSSLRLLNLSRNHLEGGIPASISEICTLEQLDLAKNNLSGGIPQDLSKLSMLAVLDVSFNSLCGPIPTCTQFSTFSSNSFQRNKCLWGFPLDPYNEKKKTMRKGNAGKSSKVNVGWINYVNEKISLIALSLGLGIGFGGVVVMFIAWKRARNWVLGLPHKRSPTFYGMYRFPT